MGNLTVWVSGSPHAERPPDALGLDPDPEEGCPVSDLYRNLDHVLLLSPAARLVGFCACKGTLERTKKGDITRMTH
jgi:hypothetical protein